MTNKTIRFPYLELEFHPGQTFEIFGIQIAYYSVIIGIAIVVGALVVYGIARKTRQNIENYLDFTLCAIPASIVGARLYFCIFNWEYYAAQPLTVITGISEGGLAIYGAIIAAVIALIVFARVRKCGFWLMADTACVGLCIGQAIGRWGNFFNREAFGGYTNSILAMQIPTTEAHGVTRELLLNAYIYNGDSYIQVHPTFLYESIWNLVLFVILIVITRYKKFNGQTFAVYLFGYGLGRTWIEMLRTDKLLIMGTSIPASIIVSIAAMAFASSFFTYKVLSRRKASERAGHGVQSASGDSGESKANLRVVEEIVKDGSEEEKEE